MQWTVRNTTTSTVSTTLLLLSTYNSHYNQVDIFTCLYYLMLFIFYNYNLHFIFQYILLINKCKRHLAILRHCQLYIKALLVTA